MPVNHAPAQPILVLNPYTGRYLDVQPLLLFLDEYCPSRSAGDPGNIVDMLQDVQDFIAMNTRHRQDTDGRRTLEEMADISYTIVGLRRVFAAMKEIG